MTHATEGTAESADGARIRYKSLGEGSPAVVFVHAWGLNMKVWDCQVPAVASKYRVVLLDLCGYGESSKERRVWTVAAFAEDVCAVCDALKLTRVVLVGHSMGGPIILEAALRLADRVAGLVPVDILLDVDAVIPADKRSALFGHMREDFEGTVASFTRTLFPPAADGSSILRVVAMETANDPTMMISALDNAMAYDARPALSRLKAPILGINADLSPTMLEHNRKYASKYDAVVMKGVSHWLMLDRPEEFSVNLLAVLDKIQRS
jgi:sigma-B regulation protein RsbQ